MSLIRSQAATRAGMLHCDPLERADARPEELAKVYDQTGIAGQQCERANDALRERI
ncbi:DUF2514 family protein [Pseudomonas putida]|uniref:DUF2514 family protein n=1 Tax=Pseudomonas putida TaxID=303 RepID=UPI0039057995